MKPKKLGMAHAPSGPGAPKPIRISKGGITNIGRVGKSSFGFGRVQKHG